MRISAILFFLLIFSLAALGQPTPNPNQNRTPKPVKTMPVKLGSETEELEKALKITNPAERIEALQSFTKNFPESAELLRAQNLIVTARAELGVIKLQAKDIQGGIELYKTAVAEAPTPLPDELFSKVLLGFPVSLYTLNERGAAFDIAKLIEEKAGASAAQILDLSRFYLNVEYGTEAIRLAQKSVELAPDAASGHEVLAAAYRLNFRLDDAAGAYAKAIELGGDPTVNKLSLADMKRALGKPDEAAALYREILAAEAENKPARAGLALALLDAGKRADAEAELKKALEDDPKNARLLTSAAYWYAARGFSEQAIEYAQRAIAVEPRNVWSYIAQARALTAQKRPLEAEKILLAARQYSDFPTLDYELASVRLAAGLYREAAETLKRSFAVNKDGAVETYLGNRILADANSFAELLSLERRVALFETKAADTDENTAQLKSLLQFNQKLDAKDATEDELAQAAEEFARGTDNMRLHRQLFAASRLLQKKAALPKVIELTQAAVAGVDSALNVPNPSASVLADEIYESRQYAISQNLVIVVPDIPRQTLSAIIRGQIETIAGRALLEQKDVPQAVVRLKRALSILPDKSAWQRASSWHLGEALQAEGKETEALEAYIKSYNRDLPDLEKRAFIENLYVKVKGNVDGLDERIGTKPDATVATTDTKATPDNTDNVKKPLPTPFPEVKPEPGRIPIAEATPQPTVIKPEPTPMPTTDLQTALPENLPTVTPAPSPEATPQAETDKPAEIKPEETKEVPVKPDESKPDESKPEETKPVEDKPEVTTTTPENKPEEVKTEPRPTPAETPEAKPVEVKTEEEVKPETVKRDEPAPAEKSPVEEKPVEKPAETKTEPSPQPQNAAVIITDNLSPIKPAAKVSETKPETKTNEQKPAANTEKPIFEPVIISVGASQTAAPEKKAAEPTDEKLSPEPAERQSSEQNPAPEKITETLTEQKKAATTEKPVEPVTNPAVVITDNLNPENKPLAVKTAEKKPDEKILSGEFRPRIIITENTGTRTVTEEIATCKLVVAPDSLSLLNGGGSLGVNVGFDGDGDFRQIRAASSSAEDVEVRVDTEIGASQNRAFFIIKSVSTKTGVFTVTFEAPCGRKEILVRVR